MVAATGMGRRRSRHPVASGVGRSLSQERLSQERLSRCHMAMRAAVGHRLAVAASHLVHHPVALAAAALSPALHLQTSVSAAAPASCRLEMGRRRHATVRRCAAVHPPGHLGHRWVARAAAAAAAAASEVRYPAADLRSGTVGLVAEAVAHLRGLKWHLASRCRRWHATRHRAAAAAVGAAALGAAGVLAPVAAVAAAVVASLWLWPASLTSATLAT